MTLDEKTRTELEAAAFRRLTQHLRERVDVQNIDLMTLAGFCRNCLSNWLKEEADARGLPLSKEEMRTHVYGMPYEDWKAKHQSGHQVEHPGRAEHQAAPEQTAAIQSATANSF